MRRSAACPAYAPRGCAFRLRALARTEGLSRKQLGLATPSGTSISGGWILDQTLSSRTSARSTLNGSTSDNQRLRQKNAPLKPRAAAPCGTQQKNSQQKNHQRTSTWNPAPPPSERGALPASARSPLAHPAPPEAHHPEQKAALLSPSGQNRKKNGGYKERAAGVKNLGPCLRAPNAGDGSNGRCAAKPPGRVRSADSDPSDPGAWQLPRNDLQPCVKPRNGSLPAKFGSSRSPPD